MAMVMVVMSIFVGHVTNSFFSLWVATVGFVPVAVRDIRINGLMALAKQCSLFHIGILL